MKKNTKNTILIENNRENKTKVEILEKSYYQTVTIKRPPLRTPNPRIRGVRLLISDWVGGCAY